MCASRSARGIRNRKVFPGLISSHLSRIHFRVENRVKEAVSFSWQRPLRDLSFPFSVSVKESEIHGRLGEEFPKAEIFESRKLGHLGGCLLSLEEFSSENIFMDDVEEYIYIYMQRNIVGLEGRGKW